MIVLQGPKVNGIWEKAKWLQYDDTPRTDEMREQMRRINHHGSRPRRLLTRAAGPTSTRRSAGSGACSTAARFDLHGRLYGGWWQGLPSGERLEDISIDESPVVELDFGQMNVRLLYAEVGRGRTSTTPTASPASRGTARASRSC